MGASPTRTEIARSQAPRVASRFRRAAVGPLLASFSIVIGIAAGIGVFTFGYGEGWAYLANNPASCANCHVMQGHFDGWQASSHHGVATCNDCHLPHDFLGKWITKADNGFFHSLAFTLDDFHEPITIKPRNRRVTQGACLHCHGDFVHTMVPVGEFASIHGPEMLSCVHCHRDVGHARR